MTIIDLDLTPEEERKAKEVFAKEGQTIEEGLKKLLCLTISEYNQNTKMPTITTPAESAFIEASIDKNGVVIIPDNAPDELKDWVNYG